MWGSLLGNQHEVLQQPGVLHCAALSCKPQPFQHAGVLVGGTTMSLSGCD
jgi:hypothetical protein